jgi:hypothetical protein
MGSSLSRSAASSSLLASEVFLFLFGAVLVLGLIGEYRESWKRHIKKFEMLVIIGVAGELLADGGVFFFSERLQTIAETEISDTNRRAAEANRRAGEAEQRAAELLQDIQPRYLSREEMNKIATDLRPFSGCGLFIATHWVDAEAIELAKQIRSALRQAGIGLQGNLEDEIGRYPQLTWGGWGGGGFSGTEVHVGVEVWGTNKRAVQAVAAALASTGKLGTALTITPGAQWPQGLNRNAQLGIFVGVKPLPDLK